MTLVVPPAEGGLRAHARMLAGGLADRGIAVAEAGLSPWHLTADGCPDVVHAHGVRAGALAAIALAARAPRGRPALVVTVHNAPPDGGRVPRLVYLLLERIVARRADLALAVSPDLEDRLRAAGARQVEPAVVPAPVPVVVPPPAACPHSSDNSNKREAPGSEEPDKGALDKGALDGEAPGGRGPDGGRPLILAVGRLAPQKDFGTLIDAAGAWRDRVPRPRLLIAGDGPLRAELEARAARSGADVEFPGRRDDVGALLGRASVFVMPSRWEGQPLALQEALAAGVPVVASDAGGIPALTGGGEAAVLVEPGNAERLGRAVLSVLDDPALAGRLRAAARARAARLPSAGDAVTAVLDAYARARE